MSKTETAKPTIAVVFPGMVIDRFKDSSLFADPTAPQDRASWDLKAAIEYGDKRRSGRGYRVITQLAVAEIDAALDFVAAFETAAGYDEDGASEARACEKAMTRLYGARRELTAA